MKRFFAVMAAVGLLAGMLAGCSAKTEASSAAPSAVSSSSSQTESQPSSVASSEPAALLTNEFAEGTQAYENFGISCEIPKAWKLTENENGNDYFYPQVDNGIAFLMIQHSKINGSIQEDAAIQGLAEGVEKSLTNAVRIKCELEENGAGFPYGAIQFEGELQGVVGRFYYAVFDAPGGLTSVSLVQQDDCEKDISEDFQRVVDTVRAAEQSAPESKPAASQAPEAPAASETMGQRNAVSKAKDYLRLMAFSHSGLVQQLEFEGFTNDEATYAADQCGADWSVQASKKAQDYLDTMSFSRSGLIKQLEFEGFTNEEATGAVDACGADWNEQAAQKAQDYLDTMSMSRSGLLQQLQFEGFTAEQAEYGVAAVGY